MRVPGRSPSLSRNSNSLRSRSYTLAIAYAAIWLRLAEQEHSPLAALFRTAQSQPISVRAGVPVSQFPDQSLLKSRGHGVFQSFCFIMDLVPGHAEDLGQHPLDQVVANHGAFRNFAS